MTTPFQPPGTGIAIHKLGREKLDASADDVQTDKLRTKSTCFSSDDTDYDGYTSSDECYGPVLAVEVTDDGFRPLESSDPTIEREPSYDGTIRSESSFEGEAMITSGSSQEGRDTSPGPLLERVPLVRVDANGNYHYPPGFFAEWDTYSQSSSQGFDSYPLVHGQNAEECETASVNEAFWTRMAEASNKAQEDFDGKSEVSDSLSETSGYWVPLERVSLRETANPSLTLYEDETEESDYYSETSKNLYIRKQFGLISEDDDEEDEEDESKKRSLDSNFFKKPKSEHSFTYSEDSTPSLRSSMSDVSQDLIDAMVLSPSTASVFSVQSDGSSHLSDSTYNSVKVDLASLADLTIDEQPLPSGVEYYPQDDVSLRSPIASMDSISVQSSFSYEPEVNTVINY